MSNNNYYYRDKFALTLVAQVAIECTTPELSFKLTDKNKNSTKKATKCQ